MKRDRIARVMMIFVTVLTLSAGSIAYGDSSTSILPMPQSSISAYQYVKKKIVVGSTTHTAFGVVPVHGNQFYFNEDDLAYVLSLYQITLKYVGVAGRSLPALEYQIDDPYIGKPTIVHPFRPGESVPAYGHLAKVDINGVYVGSVAVVSDYPNFPGVTDMDAEYDGAAFGGGASLDNISAQDLMSVFKLLNVNSTLTTNAWTFQPLPAGIPKSTGPSTATIYAGGGSSTSLLPVSIETHQVFQPIRFSAPGGTNTFFGMAITPDARLALVTDDGPNFVYPINLVTSQPESPISIGAPSEDIAITPDGKMAYVTNMMNKSVTPIDLSTLKAGPAIDVGGRPLQIVISPDGKMAYVIVDFGVVPINLTTKSVEPAVGNFSYGGMTMNDHRCVVVGGKIWILTISPPKSVLIEFDPATGKTLASIDVYGMGTIALAPDGKRIYLLSLSGSIMAVDLTTKAIIWKLPVLNKTFEGVNPLLQIAPDGKTAYVEESQGITDYLVSVDLVNHKVLSSTVPVGANSFILTVAPDQPPTAAFTTSRGVGSTVIFDASVSKSDMPIAKYVWNFGDGTTVVSSTPKVKHVYANAGTYTVTLTETDTAGATVNNPVRFNGHMVMVNGGSSSARTSQSVTV